MSIRGIFIIRRCGREKALYIPCDAYPSYSARNVVSMIREADLDKVFEILVPSEFSQYFWFDAEELIGSSKAGQDVYYKDNAEFILDSLMCEYGYVINIDDEELEYYVGFQKSPQEGNRYGEKITYTEAKGVSYYPCRLVARFSFQYIKQTLLREIIEKMEEAKDSDEILIFDADNDAKKGIEKENIEPTMFTIYQKLDWIGDQISSTLDKHIDIQNRFERGLRDIDKIKMELSVYRFEIADLQRKVRELKSGPTR